MTKLKRYKAYEFGTSYVYHINEVDALLADKDAEIAELKAKLDEKDKEIKRHKYKRSLAMAYVEWLKQMSLCNYPESIIYRRAVRRERKWKELTEKFKEAM